MRPSWSLLQQRCLRSRWAAICPTSPRFSARTARRARKPDLVKQHSVLAHCICSTLKPPGPELWRATSTLALQRHHCVISIAACEIIVVQGEKWPSTMASLISRYSDCPSKRIEHVCRVHMTAAHAIKCALQSGAGRACRPSFAMRSRHVVRHSHPIVADASDNSQWSHSTTPRPPSSLQEVEPLAKTHT